MQVLLAYGLMAEHDCDMSMSEVDRTCEAWLLDRFKLEVRGGVGEVAVACAWCTHDAVEGSGVYGWEL